MSTKYFAVCARGLETVLARELDTFGASGVVESHGGVEFSGDQKVLYQVHLWSRIANRVLVPLREANVRDPNDVYEMVKAFRWETFFRGTQTLAVDCTVSGRANESFRNSHFLRLRVKDAIVDRLRDKRGYRPNIDIEAPDISVYLYLRSGRATLGLDATGLSLHERGYRRPGHAAPLKETLAAGILALTTWKPGLPFLDPLCGSGTLVLEAALQAGQIAPGLLRKKFLFMNWPEFYSKLWTDCVEEAKAKRQPIEAGLLWGSDTYSPALDQAKAAASYLDLEPGAITWRQESVEKLALPEVKQPGVFVCNPPYGERLGEEEELKPLYKAIGDTMKQRFKGWTGYVFTGNPELAKQVGLRSAQRIQLFNGPIECRLLRYDLY